MNPTNLQENHISDRLQIAIREIHDLGAPELSAYARLSENELRHYYEPHEGLFVAESALVAERALSAGYEPVSLLVEHKQISGGAADIVEQCLQRGVPVYAAEESLLSGLTGYHLARGVLCLMRRKTLPDAAALCHGLSRIAVLERVMNPTNLGAIFRSAAALGMEAVLLTKGCTDPYYKRAARVSMGTVFQVPWTTLKAAENTSGRTPDEPLRDANLSAGPADQPACSTSDLLHDLGFEVAAFALNQDSISIRDPKVNAAKRLAVVLGSEGPGLLPETIAKADYTIRIPMSHGVDSLNVAAASAVAFWQLGKRE